MIYFYRPRDTGMENGVREQKKKAEVIFDGPGGMC